MIYRLLLLLSLFVFVACDYKSELPINNHAISIPPANITPQVSKDAVVDFIIVEKSKKLITLWKQGQLIKTYPIIAMGANPLGHKQYEGDERTPEGQYYINEKHISQRFQKFLQISYPNDNDRKNAKKHNMPVGGNVGIHGDSGGIKGFFQRFDKNWTDGCISMRNADINDIYEIVNENTPILIKP